MIAVQTAGRSEHAASPCVAWQAGPLLKYGKLSWAVADESGQKTIMAFHLHVHLLFFIFFECCRGKLPMEMRCTIDLL